MNIYETWSLRLQLWLGSLMPFGRLALQALARIKLTECRMSLPRRGAHSAGEGWLLQLRRDPLRSILPLPTSAAG